MQNILCYVYLVTYTKPNKVAYYRIIVLSYKTNFTK